MARELKACGTVAAYVRHKRAGEEPCDACREAYNAGHVPRAKARSRALGRLARMFPQQYAALFAEELAKEAAGAE